MHPDVVRYGRLIDVGKVASGARMRRMCRAISDHIIRNVDTLRPQASMSLWHSIYLLFLLSLAVFYWQPATAQGQSQSSLPRAKKCSVHGPFAIEGGVQPTDTITMANDGGWCGSLSRTIKGSLIVGVPMHVTKQPAHGQVSIQVVSHGTRVYYRPEPGYSGPDTFAVLNEMFNIERTYNVTVTLP
jgi:hypothetical protein